MAVFLVSLVAVASGSVWLEAFGLFVILTAVVAFGILQIRQRGSPTAAQGRPYDDADEAAYVRWMLLGLAAAVMFPASLYLIGRLWRGAY